MLIQGRALRLKQQTQASGKLGITPGPSAVGGGREDWTVSQIIRQFMLMLLCFYFFRGNAHRWNTHTRTHRYKLTHTESGVRTDVVQLPIMSCGPQTGSAFTTRPKRQGFWPRCKCSPWGTPTYTQVAIATCKDTRTQIQTHTYSHVRTHRADLITHSCIR